MNIYIDVSDHGEILACATTPINGSELNVFIDDWKYFMENPNLFKYEDGEIVSYEDRLLDSLKADKDEELNEACKKSILDGFLHVINDEEYHFPFDMESQLNFQSNKALLESGVVDEIKWTARNPQGKYERVCISIDQLEELSLAIFKHKERNLYKYREVLLPLLHSAQTIEEVNSISWE